MLHPSQADPGNSPLVFAEYAAHQPWIAVHLGQFVGTLLILYSLILFRDFIVANTQPGSLARTLAQFGVATTVMCAAVFTLLQAVDGVTLKKMVDVWASAPADQKAAAFLVAEGVRWTEVGINSYFRLLLGLSVSLYALPVALGVGLPRWLGWVGVLSGIAAMFGGIAIGYFGFSTPTTIAGIPAGLVAPLWMIMYLLSEPVFMLWVIAISALAWRRSGRSTVVSPALAPA